MCPLSNTGRSISEGETSWEDGDSSNSFTGKDYYQKTIEQANSVSILNIFKLYNIKVIPGTYKITCPFRSHKGGQERTPSFQIFLETNTFYCHGCTACSTCVDFVAKMDGTSKVDAAYKILSRFETNFDESNYHERQDSQEALELMISFSNAVRIFRQSHFTEKSEAYIEEICRVYDQLRDKHKLKINNEGLKKIIGYCVNSINSYIP